MNQEQVQDLVARHLPGTILINPRRPAETAAKFLYWLAGQTSTPAVLSREAMRQQIWNFLNGPARWETTVQGQSGEAPETTSSSLLHRDRGTSAE